MKEENEYKLKFINKNTESIFKNYINKKRIKYFKN